MFSKILAFKHLFLGFLQFFLKMRKGWIQCSIFSSSMSNMKCIHVFLFKSCSCLYISEWNLSSLQYSISIASSSILQSYLQVCCFLICTFDYDLIFPRITVTCHLFLLRFILLVSLPVLKWSFCVLHLNKCLLAFCLWKSMVLIHCVTSSKTWTEILSWP